MRSLFFLALVAFGQANAASPGHLAARDLAEAGLKRASPADPSGYVPISGPCPSPRPSIRAATGLSPQESTWLQTRRKNTVAPMKSLLARLDISGFNAASYIDKYSSNVSALPNIGIAASGGGYRAMMNGAGAIAAFDSRTPGSTGSGQLGGLLQSATYLSGLSGGGWLVGSLYFNNFSSVQSIIDKNGQLWDFTDSLFSAPADSSMSTTSYLETLYSEVSSKSDAGYNISLTDFWGRALSFQFINAPDGGPGYTFSSIQNDTMFSAGQTPMPILISDSRKPGQVVIPISTTIYEFNPWELGSWDHTTNGFAPMQYVGSNFTNGALPDSESCITGFDNAGYVIGTSSSLFNQILPEIMQGDFGIPQTLVHLLEGVIGPLDKDDNDIAQWQPNPFLNYNPSTNYDADSSDLPLVDGGENLENIPIHPLIQPERNVDVIFAIDSSADTVATGYSDWPNGTALGATYARSQDKSIVDNIPFPAIPDQQTFVNLGLNSKPTFFGCDASNYTSSTTHPGPLIVYLPNAPYNFLSNFSTFDFTYNSSVRDAVIGNGYALATQGNGTLDKSWGTCVACAILQRSLVRNNVAVPAACKTCFKDYCWNGTLDTKQSTYMPSLKLKPVTHAGGGTTGSGSGAAALWSERQAWAAGFAAIVAACFMLA